MTWSFSRLNSFGQCKYGWYLHYLEGNIDEGSFFSEFGTVGHKVLEAYEKGEVNIFNITDYYMYMWHETVLHDAPYNAYVDLNEKYYNLGLDYFNNIDLNLDDYEILGVEKEVRFEIEGYEFVGYIDLLLKNKITGDITILDHKSASIKILKSGKVSKSDQEHFLEFKRQLYLYSRKVIEEYGPVKYLKWNMFKDRTEITIPWKQEEYDEAAEWAINTIHQIESEEEWEPNPEERYFCDNLCGCKQLCSHRYSAEKEWEEESWL